MDYEKKYNEALNWMRELYPGLHGATKEDAEHYFPELRESEDERIRNGLIEVVSDIAGGWPFEEHRITKKEALAYLERQKEQKPAEWSEEDEDNLKAIIRIIEDNDSDWKELTDWLKSLRPHYYDGGEEIPDGMIQKWASLEESSLPSNLEEAAEEFADREYMVGYVDRSALYKGFWHGAEWDREQMMKKAVEGEVSAVILRENRDEVHYAITYPEGKSPHSITDKVRVIILLKEDGHE